MPHQTGSVTVTVTVTDPDAPALVMELLNALTLAVTVAALRHEAVMPLARLFSQGLLDWVDHEVAEGRTPDLWAYVETLRGNTD